MLFYEAKCPIGWIFLNDPPVYPACLSIGSVGYGCMASNLILEGKVTVNQQDGFSVSEGTRRSATTKAVEEEILAEASTTLETEGLDEDSESRDEVESAKRHSTRTGSKPRTHVWAGF